MDDVKNILRSYKVYKGRLAVLNELEKEIKEREIGNFPFENRVHFSQNS
jgi:hypothetical protein